MTHSTLTLTPNRRLAAILHKNYQQHQLDLQKTCWETPDILPVTNWIEHLWLNTITKYPKHPPYLLNISQETFIWEKILVDTKEHFTIS